MKNDILKRAMFAMPLSKGARNSGIMSGFDEEDMQPPEEETMPSMARTPQNPEILMNNLRGDMRSVDARRQELALMVGEEAADETPPEVLAMLQMQLGQQQQGIGALPQGAAMAPPPMPGEAPMGMPMPPQGGMPPAPPAPPQGGMPPGMQSAGPLSQGGAEQAPQGYADGGMVAPPTPDGMPPMYAQAGAFVNAATRAAQSLGARTVPYLESFNAMLGRQTMPPTMTQPFLENVRGPMGRYTAQQINRGGDLIYPTFTQGVSEQAARFMQNNPVIAGAVRPAVAGMTAAAAPLLSTLGLGESTPMSADQQAAYDRTMSSLNYIDSPENVAKERDRAFTADRLAKLRNTPSFLEKPPAAPPKGTVRFGAVEPTAASPILEDGAVDEAQVAASDAAARATALDAARPDMLSARGSGSAASSSSTDSLVDFLKSLTGKKKEGEETPESRIKRIEKAKGEYAPLFDKLLASEGEDAKVNALLLLSDAGFKLASSTAPTFGMAFAEAASGIPRGFAALLAQQKDRKLKVDTAVLSKAIDDIDLQDKYAQAMQMEQVKGTLDIMKENMRQNGLLQRENLKQDREDARENIKMGNTYKQFVVGKDFDLLMERLKGSGTIVEDAGMGGRITKTKQGSFLGFGLAGNDPAVVSFLGKPGEPNPYTLRPTDNPYVRNLGVSPTTMVTDPKQRAELDRALNQIDNNLQIIQQMKNLVQNAYSPGTWFSNKVNNIFVPVGIGNPDLVTAASVAKLKEFYSAVSRGSAAAAEAGRVSNLEQTWARENGAIYGDPEGFLKNKEIAAKGIGGLESIQRNMRQTIGAQLGYVSDNLVMDTPSIGTKNDPFVYTSDPEQQRVMSTYLVSAIAQKAPANAQFYIQMPGKAPQAYTPAQIIQTLGAK